MWLGPRAYYAIAVCELVCVGALFTKWRRFVLALIVVMSVVGTILIWLYVAPRNCGCFGIWQLERRSHLLVLSIVGAASVTLLFHPSQVDRVAPKSQPIANT